MKNILLLITSFFCFISVTTAQFDLTILTNSKWKIMELKSTFLSNDVYSFHKDSTNNRMKLDSIEYTFSEEGTYERIAFGTDQFTGNWAIGPDGKQLLVDSTVSELSVFNPMYFTLKTPGEILLDEGGIYDTVFTVLSFYNTNNVALSFAVSGKVENEGEGPIENVTIETIGATTLTNELGSYSATLLGNLAYTITPSKEDDILKGVTVRDVVLLRRHIIHETLLDSPYKLIAADVNNSGTITIIDAIDIQKAILGMIDEFPDNRVWRFVPKDYEFSKPLEAQRADFPEFIKIDNLNGITPNLDFVAIKMGDLNGSATSNSNTATDRNRSSAISLTEQQLQPNQIITIPFALGEAVSLAGFQLGIQYEEAALELIEVVPAANSGFDYSLKDGTLRTIWSSSTVATAASKNLFQLKFKVKEAIWLSDALQQIEKEFPSQIVDNKLTATNVQLQFSNGFLKPLTLNTFPNPTKDLLNVEWNNAFNHGLVDIIITNSIGQQVLSAQGKDNQAILNLRELEAGLYTLQLTQNGQVGFSKFLKVE